LIDKSKMMGKWLGKGRKQRLLISTPIVIGQKRTEQSPSFLEYCVDELNPAT